MEKTFCAFLERIGMIDKDTSSIFLKVYNAIYSENPEINIFDLSYQVLMSFLNNITDNQKDYMCHTIPFKFYEIHEKKRKDKIISILMKNKLKNKISILKHLLLWKNKSLLIKKEEKDNSKKKKKVNSLYNNNSSYKRTNQTSCSDSTKKIISQNTIPNNITKEDKINSFSDQVDFSYENNFPKNSNLQLFIFNTTKNSTSSGMKLQYNNDNKKLDKSESFSGDKTLNSKKRKPITHYRSTYNHNTISKYYEIKELEECTFKPKINNLKKSINPSKSNEKIQLQKIFDKLYSDNEKYKLSKQMKSIEVDLLANKEMTFNPNLNNIQNLLGEEKKAKFDNRIKSYIELNNKHSYIDRNNKINEAFSEMGSFTPKMKNNFNVKKCSSGNSIFVGARSDIPESEMNTIPAYQRLYDESKIRNKKQIKRKQERDDYITSLSNSISKRISSVDYNKLNELYENKKKFKIYEKTRNKVESEEGITFKPYIYKSKYTKNICSDFYERNTKFLDDKTKFINQRRNSISSKQKKKKSYDNRKEIVKNIVDRLYNESRSRKANHLFGCDKYIKNGKVGRYNSYQ